MSRPLFLILALCASAAGCASNLVIGDAHPADGASPTDAAAPTDADASMADPDVVDVPEDVAPDVSPDVAPDVVFPPVGVHGGTVDRLRFAVFGDIRPPIPDQNSAYPSAIFGEVMAGVQDLGVQFAVSTGDYMNANFCASCVDAQLDMLTAAEARFSGHVFHALGNHECATLTSYNCESENETSNIRTFRTRLLAGYDHTYFDWIVHTSMGDAHFIATAPNAWSPAQATWFNTVLAYPAAYTIVIAHEPPSAAGPGTVPIEDAMALRTGGVSLRLYGHVHEYSHVGFNGTVTGNAGAPLSGTGSYFGFVVIEQRADGNLVVNAYEVGHPPMLRDSFVVQPNGMPGR